VTQKEKFLAFLRQVHDKTKAGVFKWENTPNEDAFRLALRNGTLILSKGTTFADAPAGDVNWMAAELVGPDGLVADELTTRADADGNDYRLLLAIWQMARLNARNGEQLLDRLLDEVR
jgi:hypothetical protein